MRNEAPGVPINQFRSPMPTMSIVLDLIPIRGAKAAKPAEPAEPADQNRRSRSGSRSWFGRRASYRRAVFLLAVVGLLSTNPGCNERRYQPANWQSPFEETKLAAKDERDNRSLRNGSTLPSRVIGNTTLPARPGRNSTLPARPGGNTTLPGRNRGGLTTLPARSTTLPQRLERGSSRGTTLPLRTRSENL